MELDLGKNALKVFGNFTKQLSQLISNQKFDFVLGCGDSGAVMAAFTKMIYKELGQSIPPVVLLPVYRKINSSKEELMAQKKALIDIASEQLGVIEPKNILFVDDEIGTGDSLRISLESVINATGVDDIKCVVLAEDDGFKGQIPVNEARIDFKPFSKHKDNLYNAIFWFIPYELEKPIENALHSLKTVDKDKWPMNILLEAPIKTRTNDGVTFTYDIHNQVLKLLPNLAELQNDFQKYVRKLVRQTLK